MKAFLEIVKEVLIPVFYKEAQLGRSLRKSNQNFKKELFNAVKELSKKADNSTLKNTDIRKKIEVVSIKSNVSIGQAQKLINVYLKYYCIITGKPLFIIKELDCPLDSLMKNRFKAEGLKRISLKDMNNGDYKAWQNYLENEGKGIRLQPDFEVYDKKRIEIFLS